MSTLSRQLGWSHFVELLPLKKHLQRDFYAEMCRIVRALRAKIDGMLYECTALAKKPDRLAAQELKQLREEDRLTPDLVFRDPYLLDFPGLKGVFSEKDLEAAILRELESFLVELGGDWAFIARQKRITVLPGSFSTSRGFHCAWTFPAASRSARSPPPAATALLVGNWIFRGRAGRVLTAGPPFYGQPIDGDAYQHTDAEAVDAARRDGTCCCVARQVSRTRNVGPSTSAITVSSVME